MPHEKSFMETTIPRVVSKTKSIIENMLQEATSISLIIDIWDSKQMADFMGVCASLTFPDLSRKLVVIGLERMLGDGHHNAENIGLTIGKIVSQYKFNKNKIKSIVCDEGSALLRLLKQLFNLENEEVLDDDILKNIVDDEVIDESVDLELLQNYNNDNEIQEIVEDIQPLEHLAAEDDVQIEVTELEDENEANDYNLNDGNELIEDLTLLIGSNKYPRFSCVNHKANLAIRKTIKQDKSLQRVIKKLNKYSSSTHMSVIKSREFIIKKNRLRSENLTRWSSTFLLILSFYKAHVKGIFNENNKCPVERSLLVFYLTLLMPIYKLSLYHQRNSTTIAQTIPSIKILILKYQKLAQDGKKSQFCLSLIKNLEKKFEYELNSNTYAVASLLDVGKIKDWTTKSFANDLKIKAFNFLGEVADEMLINRVDNVEVQEQEPTTSSVTTSSASTELNKLTADESFDFYFSNSDDDDSIDKPKIVNRRVAVAEETKIFKNLLQNSKTKIITKKFWIENKKDLPLLFELASILLNIPSSSAYVERFFSICGVVNRKRAGNMSDETLINRAFLKTNLKILNDINNY
jgi:hypothetical protein